MIYWLTKENLEAFKLAITDKQYEEYISKLDVRFTYTIPTLAFLCYNQEILCGKDMCMLTNAVDAYMALAAYRVDHSDVKSIVTLGSYYINGASMRGLNIDLNTFINVTVADNTITYTNAPTPVNGMLSIPDNVITIDCNTYKDCLDIEHAQFGRSCTIIDAHAFDGCANMVSADFNERLSLIDTCAFKGTALTRVELPNSLRRICKEAFADCAHLVSVEFKPGVHTIGCAAFRGTAKLQHVNLPMSVTKLGEQAFALNSSLMDINVDHVEEVGRWCFSACRSLVELRFSPTLRKLGDNFAENCTSLKAIYIPGDIESVSKNAFSGLPTDCTVYVQSRNGNAPVLMHLVGTGVKYEVI